MVTFTDDHGTWHGLLCTIFFACLYIAVFVYIANKDWLNNKQIVRDKEAKTETHKQKSRQTEKKKERYKAKLKEINKTHIGQQQNKN